MHLLRDVEDDLINFEIVQEEHYDRYTSDN